MKTISLCLIVKDETDYLKNCLNSVKDIMDEIVIVLTSNNKDTETIAKNYTNKVYNFKWINDFSAARNFAFSKATSDYIMWLDADDILTDLNADKLKEAKTKIDDSIDYYSMIYDYGSGLTFRRNRIVKREKNFKWIGFIHEYVNCYGSTTDLDITVTHTRVHSNGTRNLDTFEYHKALGTPFSSRDTFYYARELYYNERYDDAIENFNKFLSIPDIWSEDKFDAFIKLSECYKAKNEKDKELDTLFQTYKVFPRAEAIYRIGNIFMGKGQYDTAIYFFESIFNLEIPETKGFITKDMWDFLPYLQLCVCYYKKGNIDKSYEYHLKTKSLKPKNQSVKTNDVFFKSIMKK